MQASPRPQTTTILQAALSGLGLLMTGMGAALTLLLGLGAASSGQMLLQRQAGVFLGLAWIQLFIATLALPSLWYSIRRLRGKEPAVEAPDARSGHLRAASLALLLWPAVLAAGHFAGGSGLPRWLVLPPLSILAAVLPLWWLVEFARRRLPAAGERRTWGALNFGVYLSAPLVMLVEVIGLILLGTAAAVYVGSRPELMQAVEDLSRRIMSSGADPQILLRIYRPFLERPWVIFGAFALLSGVVPLVEELLKPLVVWVMLGRRLSPADGFVLGALSGAAFALVETLFSLANPAEGAWLILVIGRAGTGLLHTATSALVGWGLVEAWQNKRYLRLGGAYLLAVFLHGLWNAFSVTQALGGLLSGAGSLASAARALAPLAPYGMAAIALVNLLLLWGLNASLRLSAAPLTEPANPL